MTHACPSKLVCRECGIRQSDGYVLECSMCRDRRRVRLRRGQLFSPTGFPGEAIDNSDARGRIVAHHGFA